MDTSYEQQAGALLEQIADGFYVLDREWHVQYASERAHRFLAIDPSEIVGRLLWEAVPEYRGTPFEERLRAAAEAGKPDQFEMRGVRTGRWLRVGVRPCDEGLAVAFWDLSAEGRSPVVRRPIYATAPVGLFFVDRDLRLLSANEQATAMSRQPCEDRPARTVLDLFPRCDGLVEALLRQVIHTGKPVLDYAFEWTEPLSPDERYYQASFHPVKNSDGTVLGVNGVVQDLTQCRRQEEAHRLHETRFRTLLNALPDLVWLSGPDGAGLGENQRFRDYFGCTATEAFTSAWITVLHPEEYAAVMDRWEHSLRTGQPYEKEVRLPRYDGTYRWHLSRALPIHNSDGEVAFWCGACVDIHDRKQAERQLHVQAHLLDAVEQAVIATDLEGRITAWNRYAEALFGWSEAEVLGRNILEVTPSSRMQRLAGAIMERLRAGKSWSGEIELQRRDGSTFPAYVIDSPIHDEHGRLAGVVGVSMDITERRQAEQALREAKEDAEAANAAKSVFLANMSHEIRTPLTAMIGFASLLARQLEGKPKSYAERIEQGGKRLTETLGAILTLSRLESGTLSVDLQEVDVASEVKGAASPYRLQAERKGLCFKMSVRPGAEHARARLDTGALTSILQHFLSNAIKFTEHGEVAVTVATNEGPGRAGRIEVHVEDTGIGIDPAFLPHLFEPFRQESSGLSRSHEGTGLGMTIARQLAEKMSGTVYVTSEKQRGTRLTVSFPLLEARAERPIPGPSAHGDGRPPRPRMLVVEDHEDTRLLIEDLLQDRYEVLLMSDADEALGAVQDAAASAAGPFQAILLGVNLDHAQNGTSLLRKILSMPVYESVPVAALSAGARPGDGERFVKEGFAAYLRKPFIPDELNAVVTRLLGPGLPSPGLPGNGHAVRPV